jgi:hypothetical protein
MIIKEEQPGFENEENLVQHACRGMDFSMISGYFGQQCSSIKMLGILFSWPRKINHLLIFCLCLYF